MGDNSWWFNRAGTVAPLSNPSGAGPNYGLTSNLTSAPYDNPDQFDALASALQAQGATQTMYGPALPGFSSVAQTYTPDQGLIDQAQQDNARWQFQRDQAKQDTHKSWWDKTKGAAGWVGSQAAGVAGEVSNATQYAYSLGHENIDWGWGDTKKHQIEGTKKILGEVASAPGVDKIFWGLNKLNQYSATALLASSTANDHGFFDIKHPWNEAAAIQKKEHVSFGEALMSTFADPEVVKDSQRFEALRQHNGVFAVGALAANVYGSWKFDPNVYALKGVGAARDLSAGKLATSGRTMQVQRDILSQPSLEEAKTAAKKYSGLNLADNLRASHSLSLYQRSQQMRVTAQAVNSGEVSFESFMNAPAFKNTASGPVLAKLMVDTAHSDENWNLIFRSALGDPTAVGDLLAKQGAVADKINAIELGELPRVTSDLNRAMDRYNKRLAEQGRPQDAAIEITRFGDKWLDDEVTSLQAENEALNARLSGYEEHESWLQRALPGVADPKAPDVDAMRSAFNTTFNSLDRLGGDGVVRRSLTANGGAVKAWGLDDYSPTSWIFRAPTKPFLKRVGVANLNDVSEGGSAVQSYLDQLGHITGNLTQEARDKVLSDWVGATTDIERKAVLERLVPEAIQAVGAKHGLSPELMDKLAKHIQDKRGKSWGNFSNKAIYSPIMGEQGRILEYDGAKIKMPIDPTQLPNWFPMTNLTDVERLIRLHADDLRGLDKELASRKAAGVAWTARHSLDVADQFGTWFNSMWKPMALLSIRWPARVVADESMRVILSMGAAAHAESLREGVGNFLYNNGVVRPTEWWAGRKVKTGSVGEDSLRASTSDGYDPFDYRAVVNPSASVPADTLDLGKVDAKRYDALNAATAKRGAYLRKLEAHRANVREAKKTSPQMGDAVAAFTEPERPAWARKWDERLNEAHGSETRGFFMDPVTHRPNSTGFAVSPYPSRLRTFDKKPSARDLNYWTEKNSDVLSIPNNRIAVWHDKDTGRWHLDVVKTAKRREDAMLLASKHGASEFYDINDGFTRYLSEDFYNHFDSPLVKPPVEDAPLGAAADMFQVDDAASQAGAEIGAKLGGGQMPQRRQVGFGKAKWKTLDGKTVEGERVFGKDTANPNIQYGVTSSKGAFENLYGGYTKGLGMDRRARMGSDYKWFDPDNNLGTETEWAKAWSHFVNRHIRYSPLFQRMMDGKSDDEIFNWLMGSPEGRSVRKRMGARGENPHRWVDQEREIFDHMFPTDASLEAAKKGEVDPSLVPSLIPEGMRPSVNGDTIKMALGTHQGQKAMSWAVSKAMDVLATKPTDALVRHPYANTVYNREMRNYLASVPAHQITNDVLAAAEASARSKAVQSVRKVLYNMADEIEAEHMLRFVAPFFQAQLEVMQKYGHLITSKPESLARLAQLFVGTQVLPTPLWQVVDREGKKVKGYSSENQVIFQVTKPLKDLVDHIPGLKHSLDYAGDISVPVSSLNLITQGDMPYLPSLGPLVTYPASEFYFKGKPEMEQSSIYKWLYPFGTPKGSNFAERGMNTLLPAYARRGFIAGTADMSDSAFANLVSTIGATQLQRWEMNGKHGPMPTGKDALEAAKAAYRLRMASSFVLPAPVTPRSPYQHWIDMYRQYQQRYGDQADEKFYDLVSAKGGPGLSFFDFAQSATKSAGMAPEIGSKKAYDKYKGIVEQAPDMLSVLVGPYATGEFSDAVYQWQLDQPLTAAGSDKMRTELSPQQRLDNSQISRGWVEYSKLSSVIDAELRNRVANGGSAYLTANSNQDLQQYKNQQMEVLFGRNPAWQDAYNSRNKSTASWLTQAYNVSFDKQLDDRPDIQGLRAYLIGRAKLQDALVQRQNAGLSSSRQFSFDPLGNPIGDNADLYVGWMSWINELKAKNPLFSEIYNRYLESDDLSTYIDPEVSGG